MIDMLAIAVLCLTCAISMINMSESHSQTVSDKVLLIMRLVQLVMLFLLVVLLSYVGAGS